MDQSAEYARDLREALMHLYDPAYRPPIGLCVALGCDPVSGLEDFRRAILSGIDGLRPAAMDPSSARSRRLFEVLWYRYVEQLTQEDAAERLGISPRHLRREQQQALRLLAEKLLLRGDSLLSALDPEETADGAPAELGNRESAGWRAQAIAEIQSLRHHDPELMADVLGAATAAIHVIRALASQRGVGLRLGFIEPGLAASLHPSGLRQALISGISQMIRHMSSGYVAIAGHRDGDEVVVEISGNPVRDDEPISPDVDHGLLTIQGGKVTSRRADGVATISIALPSSPRTTVLVVDDNSDLVHFYERYVQNTEYHIVSAASGQEALQILEEQRPDIIVLDVMLPDMDGWDMLIRLHEHPSTRDVPIVVCSVVREEELSFALGASLYVAKPVSRQQFRDALARAAHLAQAASSRARANSAIAD